MNCEYESTKTDDGWPGPVAAAAGEQDSGREGVEQDKGQDELQNLTS